jgi:hypothetical protein
MAKDWEDLDYHQKDKKLYQYADQYGIDPGDYARGERESGAYGTKGDWDDFENDVLRAASNDYDTRNSIDAGKAAGNSNFDNIGDGISDLGELFDVNKALKKTHKDMGNTGNFSSSNDFGNVSNFLNQSAATAAKDEVMNQVNSRISQAMTGDKDNDDDSSSSETNTNMTYNEFLGLEGEVQKASSGFDATDTPAQQAQSMLFNAVNEIANDEENMDKAKYNQDKYNLELGSNIFN